MALQAKIDHDFGSCIGTIGFVSIKELPQVDQFENTHRASFTIQGANKSGDPKAEKDSIFFAAGSIKGGKLTAKDSEGNWQELVKGCDVKFQFVQNGDWFNVKRSQITITKVVAAQAAAPAGSAPQGNRDFTGIKVGHLQNCTENFLGVNAFADGKTYMDTAKEFDAITGRVADALKSASPEISAYDLGATSGRAVLNASSRGFDNLADVESFAINATSSVVRSGVTAIVKGASKEPAKQEPKKQKPEPMKAANPKINPQEPTIDFDDDIPF